jgi:hypothetical protein
VAHSAPHPDRILCIEQSEGQQVTASRQAHQSFGVKKSSVIVQYTTEKNQNLVIVITEIFRAVYVGEKSVAVLCE